ncbi:CLUMA_CG016351, isoform A [Clunio marinus]|uniref:CLUMA_CG016351, isoform A n=1 Tax=Clunio marinus TaxID=568069 RepID=A0A1J1IVD8_9DIPT|nr:CLUMA_CG016351, isoform A [Clunio marinus]
MKVDKSVSTSNDALFTGTTPANELNSIIKFETVFTTLVENKILAIKRECEQHENKKKSRTLKNFLSRKSDLAVIVDDKGKHESDGDIEPKKKTKRNFFLRHKKQQSDVDVEKGEQPADNERSVASEIAKVEVENDKTDKPTQGLLDASGKEPPKLDSHLNEHITAATKPENVSVASENVNDRISNCDKILINNRTEHAQLTVSTNNSSNVLCNNTAKDSSPLSAENNNNKNNNELDESLATTADISLQQQSSVVVQVKPSPINDNNNTNNKNNNVNNNNGKSDVAICDDGASSQNTSDIEFSLVSESISELPANVRSKKTSTNSDPIIKKPVLFLSPPLTREAKVNERKAISCQSTPLFGRHQQAPLRSEGENKKVLTFQKELPKKSCEPKAIEKTKSQTIVIAPTSTTTTTTLAKPLSSATGPLEHVHSTRKSQKHSKYRDVSVEYEISYDDDGNLSPRGFISSFNQLTSQMPPAAVITTTTTKKQSTKHPKVQSIKDEKAQQENFIDGRSDDKTAKHHEIELELDDIGIDIVNKKKKRRRRSSRGSDPVVYPSSSGLKHCILSRPPNQPICENFKQSK